MQNFIIAKATDVGKTRQVNEDSMTVFDSVNGHVMAVCDGMGGQAAGDQASQLAVNIIENILTDNRFNSPEEAIRSSIMAANQGILNRQAQNPELEGMGATCVMLIIKDGKVHCGWVGDSRIYYINNHTIRQISKDQSYVQQLVDAGQITAAEAEHHPQKNEITNALGIPNMTPPEMLTFPITPEPGSTFLLCSDGLSGMVDNDRIERVISSQDLNLNQKANKLVELANEAGGLDNITVELVQFMSNGGNSNVDSAEGTSKKGFRKLSVILAFVCLLICIAGGAYFGLREEPVKKPAKVNTVEKKQNKQATKTVSTQQEDVTVHVTTVNNTAKTKKEPVKKDDAKEQNSLKNLQQNSKKAKNAKEQLENVTNKGESTPEVKQLQESDLDR